MKRFIDNILDGVTIGIGIGFVFWLGISVMSGLTHKPASCDGHCCKCVHRQGTTLGATENER